MWSIRKHRPFHQKQMGSGVGGYLNPTSTDAFMTLTTFRKPLACIWTRGLFFGVFPMRQPSSGKDTNETRGTRKRKALVTLLYRNWATFGKGEFV